MGDSVAECETANLHKCCFGFPCNVARALYIVLFAKQTKCCERRRKITSYFTYCKWQSEILIYINCLPWNQTLDLRLKIFLCVWRHMPLIHEMKERLWNQTAPRKSKARKSILKNMVQAHTCAVGSPAGCGSPLALKGFQHSERITPISHHHNSIFQYFFL